MERIESFRVDHRVLKRGIYVSRIDEDIITYDIRMTHPNIEPALDPKAVRTIEHIGATLLRNGNYQKDIIYFGPMGCMTGFYLIVRHLDLKTVTSLVKEIYQEIATWKEEIPGAKIEECGNYLYMNLKGAKEASKKYI